MTKSLLVSASALAIATATPAFAADVMMPETMQETMPQTFPDEYFQPNKAGGYIDLHYGFVGGIYDTFGGSSDWSWRTIGLYGRANLPIPNSDKMNLQLDGTADNLFVAGKGSVGLATPIEFTAHLYGRDPESHALGVFGSFGVANGQNIWGIGVEAQRYINRLTLYGQAGYRTEVHSSFANMNEWYVRGVGRYFATDNVRLEGELGYSRFGGSFPTSSIFFWGATGEFRFDQFPLGVYAQYRGNSYNRGGPSGTTHELRLGVRGHLGTNSLIDNDRHAASFDTRPLDPWFYGKSIGP